MGFGDGGGYLRLSVRFGGRLVLGQVDLIGPTGGWSAAGGAGRDQSGDSQVGLGIGFAAHYLLLCSSSAVYEEVPAVQTQPVRSTALPNWATARRTPPAAAGAILPSRISSSTVRSRSARLW